MANAPHWLKTQKGHRLKRWDEWWAKPWTVPLSSNKARAFKRCLREHGYLSPNFTLAEASGKSRNRYGSDVPAHLIGRAQRHAFRLERARHDLGGPISILSWYRNERHNDDVGGVDNSRHLYADGTDFSTTTVNRYGAARFDAVMEKHFAKGGYGRYPSGSRHADSRGYRSRW